MNSPVDLLLITGFLGAGKTTLVNHLLGQLQDGDTGVLVNDFGPVSVDGGLVRSRSGEGPLEIYEVADGSIFCSCKSADFVMGLKLFARTRPRRLIVEASGLADPRGFAKILADNRLTDVFTLRRTVCVVDLTRTYKLMRGLPAIAEQIRSADALLLNKADLADKHEITRSREMVASINPRARLYLTGHSQIGLSELFMGVPGATEDAPQEECTLPGSGPQALFLEDRLVSVGALQDFLQTNHGSLLRAKGWYSFDGDDYWYVSDNAGKIQWEQSPLPAGQQAGIVAICTTGEIDTIGNAWRELVRMELAHE